MTLFAASGMTIASGMLSYINDRSPVAQTVTDMDVTLSMKTFEQPLDANGSVTYNGEPLAVCTARGFWDTELKPMPRWQQFEAASDEIGLA